LIRAHFENVGWGNSTMQGDSRIVVVLRDDLAPWQRTNIAAFLIGGVATEPDLIVRPYADMVGRSYLPILRHPVAIFEGTAADITRTHGRASSRVLRYSIFSDAIFSNGKDEVRTGTVSAIRPAEAPLLGLAFHADGRIADEITSGLNRQI
jgi:hypothetical protein